MPDDTSQTVRHRRVSGELKRLREEQGLGTVEVSQRMNWDRTKLNRIERGDWKRLKEQDVRGLAQLYGVTEEAKQDALVAMAKQAKQKGWWARYSDLLGAGTYISLEAEASKLRFYGGMMVPGLLQTSGYARALIRGSGVDDEAEVKRRLEARLTRQKLLDSEGSPEIRAIVDEAALRKHIGGKLTMREQLLHLMLLNDQGAAHIHVLPDSAGAHQSLTGQFALLDFPSKEQDPVVFIDISRDGLFMEDPDDIRTYTVIYDSLCQAAFSPEASNEHMAHLVDTLAE
ncbi:helix-turn-helix protein [Haloactinospora alba]|uniref:Helix-turn-helix protein n=1 Tax=Haloactinospora alba TaxID=405555 RepID=A0A543NLY8_9ACTN|nr:helix-turn-helix transcriptional regulator [Haloactinospora alba]TQN32840.1 helix-turn-helix protein [Haloactinospora alba]